MFIIQVHIVVLKYYLHLGVRLERIISGMRFDQAPWMRDYVLFNTRQRQLSKTPTEKQMFKFLTNSLYGRTLLNQRKIVDVKLITNEKTARNVIAKPTFESFHVINENLTLCKLRNGVIKWMQPTQVGATILDYAKLRMYEFHYGYVMNKFALNARLLFSDTDSLAYEIAVDDLYESIKNDVDKYFDTSNYEIDNCAYSDKNKMKLGYFKDELGGKQAIEFIGLKSKMYSIKMNDDDDKITCKGVSKSFVKKHIRHEMYKDVLFNNLETNASFKTINSRQHVLCTREINKKALSSYDANRFIIHCGNKIVSLPLGHFQINRYLARNNTS